VSEAAPPWLTLDLAGSCTAGWVWHWSVGLQDTVGVTAYRSASTFSNAPSFLFTILLGARWQWGAVHNMENKTSCGRNIYIGLSSSCYQIRIRRIAGRPRRQSHLGPESILRKHRSLELRSHAASTKRGDYATAVRGYVIDMTVASLTPMEISSFVAATWAVLGRCSSRTHPKGRGMSTCSSGTCSLGLVRVGNTYFLEWSVYASHQLYYI